MGETADEVTGAGSWEVEQSAERFLGPNHYSSFRSIGSDHQDDPASSWLDTYVHTPEESHDAELIFASQLLPGHPLSNPEPVQWCRSSPSNDLGVDFRWPEPISGLIPQSDHEIMTPQLFGAETNMILGNASFQWEAWPQLMVPDINETRRLQDNVETGRPEETRAGLNATSSPSSAARSAAGRSPLPGRFEDTKERSIRNNTSPSVYTHLAKPPSPGRSTFVGMREVASIGRGTRMPRHQC